VKRKDDYKMKRRGREARNTRRRISRGNGRRRSDEEQELMNIRAELELGSVEEAVEEEEKRKKKGTGRQQETDTRRDLFKVV
jgi:hypothetical protein